MVSVPLAVPEAFGEKVIARCALCPGSRVKGQAGVVVWEKTAPLTLTLETKILGDPAADALLTVMTLVLLLPTTTPPKSTEELVSAKPGLKKSCIPVPPQELVSATASRINAT
jgi:hypothetical protein